MKNQVNSIEEKELSELDPIILENYLLQLESIEAGLDEFIKETGEKNENIK